MFANIKLSEEKLFEHLKFLDNFIRKIEEQEFLPKTLKDLFGELASYFKIDHIYLIKNNNLNFWSLNFEWVSKRRKSKLYLSGNWEKFQSILNYLSSGNFLRDEEDLENSELKLWKEQFQANNILLIPVLKNNRLDAVFGFNDIEKKFFSDLDVFVLSQAVRYLGLKIDYIESVLQLRNVNKELREELDSMNESMNVFPCFVLQKNSELKYESVNNYFLNFIGLPKFHIIGKSDEEILSGSIVEEMQKCDLEAIEKLSSTLRFHELKYNNQIYHFAYNRIPIVSKTNNKPKLVIVAFDVTSLVNLKKSAELSSKLKSEFLADMSHEIRTPLNSIIGFTELLLQDVLTDEQREIVSNIKQSSNTLLELINDILDINKIEAGKLELNITNFELSSIISNLQSLFYNRFQEKNIELKFVVDKSIPEVLRGDPLRIRQILVNLIGNSLKFTNEGRVTVSIKSIKRSQTKVEHITLEFAVIDTGIGIPEEKQRRIFEAFTQADQSTASIFGGTGLGLTISKKLIDLMQGEIFVSSQEGKGSKFWFVIDLGVGEKQVTVSKRPKIEKVKRVSKQPKSRILIITDNIESFQFVGGHFKSSGLTYKLLSNLQSYSFEDILAEVRSFGPSIILLDVLLRNKSGWSILQVLKSDVTTKFIPVVICSIQEDRKKAINFGAVDILDKPITEESLINLIENLPVDGEKGGKVVVIDDDVQILKRIDEILSQFNFTTRFFVRADVALNYIFSESPPSLIVLDLMLPGIDGFQFIEELRKNEQFVDVPVIMITSKILNDLELEKIYQNCVSLIRKAEFSEESFITQLNRVLSRFGISAIVERKKEKVIEEQTRLAKIHILVVEDNLMNQKFMVHILRKIGATYDIAVDGKDCLEKIDKAKYDVILMDIQMPVMDGLEATKIIRQNPKYKDLPIIALTAHAMKGDRERCFAAGCSGYLSKPIDQQKLVSEIMSVIKVQEKKYEEINPYFQGFEAEEIYALQSEYLEQLKAEVHKLEAKLSPKDFEPFRFFGHNIKGNGVAYGFPEISKIGSKIEDASINSDFPTLTTLFEELKTLLNEISIKKA